MIECGFAEILNSNAMLCLLSISIYCILVLMREFASVLIPLFVDLIKHTSTLDCRTMKM